MHQIKILNTPSSINPFLIVYKPPFLPCAPLDFSDSENALSFAVKLFPEIKKVCGIKPCEFGLVHRLDTLTEGIFLIALNQEFYDFIQIQQKEGKFIKTYNAECDYLRENAIALSGFPKEKIELSNQIFISSFFRHYGKDLKEVRPVTETSGKFSLKKVGSKKKYTTEVKVLSKKADSFSVQCRITQGFRHQVRRFFRRAQNGRCQHPPSAPEDRGRSHRARISHDRLGLRLQMGLLKLIISREVSNGFQRT